MSETETAEPPKRGRPSSYTPEIAAEICTRLADGLSLREICQADDMPSKSTVCRWLSTEKEFQDQYVRARQAQAEHLADDLLHIADDGTNDWMERHNRDGEAIGWAENGEALRRSQLRVDTRKWLLAKLQPKKYGDKLDVEHGGSLSVNINR